MQRIQHQTTDLGSDPHSGHSHPRTQVKKGVRTFTSTVLILKMNMGKNVSSFLCYYCVQSVNMRWVQCGGENSFWLNSFRTCGFFITAENVSPPNFNKQTELKPNFSAVCTCFSTRRSVNMLWRWSRLVLTQRCSGVMFGFSAQPRIDVFRVPVRAWETSASTHQDGFWLIGSQTNSSTLA